MKELAVIIFVVAMQGLAVYYLFFPPHLSWFEKKVLELLSRRGEARLTDFSLIYSCVGRIKWVDILIALDVLAKKGTIKCCVVTKGDREEKMYFLTQPVKQRLKLIDQFLFCD